VEPEELDRICTLFSLRLSPSVCLAFVMCEAAGNQGHRRGADNVLRVQEERAQRQVDQLFVDLSF